MGEKVYRIKALEWKRAEQGNWYAPNSLGGHFYVKKENGRWGYFLPQTGQWHSCDSLSDGKARCEALYRERMERGLEVVQ